MTEIAPASLNEYLEKLRLMANGAKRALAEGKVTEPREMRDREQWWDGYTQALDDVFDKMMGAQ